MPAWAPLSWPKRHPSFAATATARPPASRARSASLPPAAFGPLSCGIPLFLLPVLSQLKRRRQEPARAAAVASNERRKRGRWVWRK